MSLVRYSYVLLLASVCTPGYAMVGNTPAVQDARSSSFVMIVGDGGTVCTATALARDLLLTASHCVLPGSDYKLLLGAPSAHPVLKDITRIERDPQFDLKRLFGH